MRLRKYIRLVIAVYLLPLISTTDNEPWYSAVFYTGNTLRAGTNAILKLRLISEKSKYSRLFVFQSDQNFKRNSINYFPLNMPYMGNICSVRIWKINRGLYSNWFLNKTVIFDRKMNASYVFNFNKWMGRQESKGIDGEWEKWGSWSECSGYTCGFGVRRRRRTCTKQLPRCGGRQCIGKRVQSHGCLQNHCSKLSNNKLVSPYDTHLITNHLTGSKKLFKNKIVGTKLLIEELSGTSFKNKILKSIDESMVNAPLENHLKAPFNDKNILRGRIANCTSCHIYRCCNKSKMSSSSAAMLNWNNTKNELYYHYSNASDVYKSDVGGTDIFNISVINNKPAHSIATDSIVPKSTDFRQHLSYIYLSSKSSKQTLHNFNYSSNVNYAAVRPSTMPHVYFATSNYSRNDAFSDKGVYGPKIIMLNLRKRLMNESSLINSAGSVNKHNKFQPYSNLVSIVNNISLVRIKRPFRFKNNTSVTINTYSTFLPYFYRKTYLDSYKLKPKSFRENSSITTQPQSLKHPRSQHSIKKYPQSTSDIYSVINSEPNILSPSFVKSYMYITEEITKYNRHKPGHSMRDTDESYRNKLSSKVVLAISCITTAFVVSVLTSFFLAVFCYRRKARETCSEQTS